MSRAGKIAPRKSPRRKAGRDARKELKKLRFTLTVEGQQMRVTFTADKFGGDIAPHGHFEFNSPFDPPRRIPVSETGYLSHFVPKADLEIAGSPQEYARSFVETALCLGKKRAVTDGRQISLF